jgi:hypothetical protein
VYKRESIVVVLACARQGESTMYINYSTKFPYYVLSNMKRKGKKKECWIWIFGFSFLLDCLKVDMPPLSPPAKMPHLYFPWS